MGIEVTYRRMPESEWERLASNPDECNTFLFSPPGFDVEAISAIVADPEAMRTRGQEILDAFASQQEDNTRVDLYKDWQALHFLLTGDDSMDMGQRLDDPLHNVVMGGYETQVESTYGAVRMFHPQEVQVMAESLAGVSAEDLRRKFSAEAFNKAEIYPNPRPGGWDADEIEGVFHIYPKLAGFFKEAARSGEIVIVYAA